MKDPDRETPFTELDHTADLRVEIRGRDEEDLFRNAVESIYLLLGLPATPAREEDAPPAERLEIHGQDREEALVELLGELLYRATAEKERFHLRELVVRAGGGREAGCTVVLIGGWRELENGEAAGQREIKAVTYHDIRIRKTRKGWSAQVVMDL